MLPPNLLRIINRLEGFSTNIFRLEPSGRSSDYAPGQIIQFDLPTNAILNPHSLKIFFKVVTSASGGLSRLPNNINKLIERVEVSMGGVQISQGTNYINVLMAAREAVYGSHADPVHGHPKMHLTGTADMNATCLFTRKETPNASGTNKVHDDEPIDETIQDEGNTSYYAFNEFPGFLESAPHLLDTSLLPDISLRITLAPADVLGFLKSAQGAPTNATDTPATKTIHFANLEAAPTITAKSYSLKDVHACIETVAFPDSLYTRMLMDQMNSEGFLEIPYHTYHNLHTNHSNSTRFTVATQSLDEMWFVWRAAARINATKVIQGTQPFVNSYKTTYTDVKGALSVNASADVPAGVEHVKWGNSADIATTTDVHIPSYGIYGDHECVPQYFNMDLPTELKRMQVQLNGTMYPQWFAETSEWAHLTKNAVGASRYNPAMTQSRFRQNFGVMVTRHNFPKSADENRTATISGIDTRAVNLQGVVNTEMATVPTPTPILDIFLKCTSTLRVGAGRSVVPIP